MSKKSDQSNYLYCAFLRGVNVKGTTMKMKEVCTLFENNGMANVNAVLASGNILFSSVKSSAELKEILEKAMSSHFNYEAFLFLKNKKELESIINSNPFDLNPDFHTYIFLGIDGIEILLKKEFEQSKKAIGEEAAVVNSSFYWKIPKGSTLDSEFSKILGQKKLKNTLTSRNINTLVKVLQKI